MKIINKQLQPTMKEYLMSLTPGIDCLEEEASKKGYIRGVIIKIKKLDSSIKFTTKVENGKIYVWRLS